MLSLGSLIVLMPGGALGALPLAVEADAARAVARPAKTAPEFQEGPLAANTAAVATPLQQRTFELALPALIGDRYLGDVNVRLTGDVVTIDVDRLATLLAAELTPDVITELRARAVDGRVTPEQATTPNITVRYNSGLQQIEISTAADVRQLREVRFGYDPGPLSLGPGEQAANFALYASTRFNGAYIWESDSFETGFDGLGGQLDLGGRIGGDRGIAFQSRHSFAFDSDPGFTRDESFLIYDDTQRLLRTTAGDLIPRGTSFQQVPSMAGVSLERFFGLEPDRLFRPVANNSFQLDRPSTIEVRINGVPQRELFLQPGRYNLRDLPLVQGSNLVDLVIRDDSGRERIISDRNFFDYDLLAPGVTDFSGAVGVKSSFGVRAPDYSDRPVLTAFARRGISNTVTAGGDIQVDQEGVNGGASVLWASPIGVFQLNASGSQRDGFGSGAAAAVGYALAGSLGDSDTRFSVDLRGEYRSPNFSTVVDTPPLIGPVLNQPTELFLNARAQAFFGRVTANASASYSKGRGGRFDTMSALAGVNYTLSSRWTVGGFARHLDDGQTSDTGIFVQVTWRPRRDIDVRARYDTSDREAQISFRKSAPRTVGSLSYGIDALHSDRDNRTVIGGDAFYVGNRFEASLRHDATADGRFSGSDRTQITRATVGTALVFADGAFAIGRPVRDSFAIISPHPTLKDKEIRVDQTERGYYARTDALGPAVNVDLVSYARRSVYYSVIDLPPGYDLGTGQFALKPSLNAGYKLTVGSGASYSLIGRIQTASGDPVAFVPGRLVSLDSPESEPVLAFTNRNGRLVATGMKQGRYRLTLDTDPVTVREITISDGDATLLDIGTIKVGTP